MTSQDGLRHDAILEVVDHVLEAIGHSLSEHVLDHTWDHAGRINVHDLLEVHATLARLKCRERDVVCGDNIRADIFLNRRSLLFVSLARMEHSCIAITCLTLVEASNRGAIRDKHRHVHLEAIHFVTFVVRLLEALEPVVHD